MRKKNQNEYTYKYIPDKKNLNEEKRRDEEEGKIKDIFTLFLCFFEATTIAFSKVFY